MKLALLVTLLLVSVFAVEAANNIWTYTSGTKLLDANSSYFQKLETRVVLDPLATPPTYVICIATLSTDNMVHVEQRRFVVGQTGAEGPELIQSDPPFNISASYKDIDIVDGADECLFAALSQDQTLYIGSETPRVNVFDRIEVVSRNGSIYVISAVPNTLDIPRDFFGDIVLPTSYSFETTVKKSGNFFIAGSFGPTDGAPITLVGTDQTGADYFTAFANTTYPTMAVYNESFILMCAEHPTDGIPCALHPGDNSGLLIIANNVTSTYFKPKLSRVNGASDLMFLSTLVHDTAQASPAIEVNVLDTSRQVILQTRFARASPYLMDASSIENYLFLTYTDATGLKMDVMYWGASVPPFPPPVAPPVTAPVAAVTPVDQTPKSDQFIDKTPQGLPGSSIGAIVGSIVGGALVAGAIVLAVLLTRRNRKRKAEKQKSEALSPKEQNSSSQDSASFSSSHYEPVVVPESRYQDSSGYPQFAGLTPGHNQTNATNDSALLPAEEIEKRMKIPYKSLVFIFELGSGNFGKVFKGEWNGAEVAIKVSNELADTDEFLAEAKLTLGINHPNVVQTFGVSLDGPNPCIVLGFCGGGSLEGLLKDKIEPLDNNQKRDYALKIAYGLLHLHQNNIVHRDLAARNILLANDGTPKISDFGMSRVITNASSVGRTKQTVGPLRWMAPENIQSQTYSPKSDVWSYGILVWEIVARREPHLDADQLLVGARIRDEGLHPTIPSDCDPALKRVMEMCWQKNAEDRPTMEDIVAVLRSNPTPQL